MIICKAPVRLSFGGGGTDFPDFYLKYGGAVLSTSINKYFYASLQYNLEGPLSIESADYQLYQEISDIRKASLSDALMIPKAVMQHFEVDDKLHISLKSDIPPGSGLGLSGAVTSSLVKLFSTFKNKEMPKGEIADLSSQIEIDRLNRPIGMQDQYASSFGGLNFITFGKEGIQVEPLQMDPSVKDRLEYNLLLFFTGTQRNSAQILSSQRAATRSMEPQVIDSLLKIKDMAYAMKTALEAGDLEQFGQLLHQGWEYKKAMSSSISSPQIDQAYQAARDAGALGGKITGAGGGGFLLMYVEKENRQAVREALTEQGLQEFKFRFESEGVHLVLDQIGRFQSAVTPEGYLLGMTNVVKRIDKAQIDQVIDKIHQAHLAGRKVFIMGNGGSAATSSHLCSELSKSTMGPEGQRGIRAIALTDNVPLMTAWGNDEGYEKIFSGQLYNLADPGDLVIVISGGGHSKSLISAIKLAKERGISTIGLLGHRGGALGELVDLSVVVPSEHYQFIEDAHNLLVHLITSILKARLAEG
ncbi:MAG: SIS domain-containing protein [bacterium]|nr:SIS domain-containing protein [bacterium]